MNDLLVYGGLLVGVAGLVAVVKPSARLGIERRRTGVLVFGLGAALALLGGTRSDDGTEPGASHMRLDDFQSVYHFHEVHALRIEAPPERIFAAIKEVTPRELGIVPGILLWIRSLPSILKGESGDRSRLSKPLLQPGQDSSWLVLAEEGNRELVIGFVGRFWEADGGPHVRVGTPEEFRAFDRPGYAKAALNFHIGDTVEGNGCRVSTETRILTTDSASQRKFGRYWQVIYPGTAMIRKGLLRAIKRRAEG
jgi:hypothetical protein